MYFILQGIFVILYILLELWFLTLLFLHAAVMTINTWQIAIKEKTIERPIWYYGNKFWDVFLNGNAFNIRKTFKLLKQYYKGE